MTACKGFVLFSITGPGVSVATDLEFGDNATDNSLKPTFLPGSTYVAQDGNQPTVARKVFTTAASVPGHAGGGQRGRQAHAHYKGQSVQKLTAGKYTVSVVDQSTKSGFTLKLANKLPVSVTGAAFVGKHAETLFITQGQWMFFTVGGPKHFFFVAA